MDTAMTEARAGLASGALAHRSDTMRDREEGGRFVIDSSWGLGAYMFLQNNPWAGKVDDHTSGATALREGPGWCSSPSSVPPERTLSGV